MKFKGNKLLISFMSIATLGLSACSLSEIKSSIGKSWIGQNILHPIYDPIKKIVNGDDSDKAQEEPGKKEEPEEEIPEHFHHWSYEHNETEHWQACDGCDEIKEKENHSGGNADCQHVAICEVCGAEYGELGQHDLGELVPKVEPTCEEDGREAYYHCEKCDKYFDEEKNEVSFESLTAQKLGHDYGDLIAKVDPLCVQNGFMAHYECSRCHKLFNEDKVEKTAEELVINSLGHNAVFHEAKESTCEESGNIAYYSCSQCDKYFSDENCEHEIEENSWVLSPIGHDVSYFEAVEALCEQAGSSAYFKCNNCGKYFSDETCQNEIEENSWIIPAKGHSVSSFEAVSPSCTNSGSNAYYKCNDCGKYFSDEACQHEIEELSWIIPATGHNLVEHSPVEKTCTENGNTLYYECSNCGKFFSDAAGEHEIAENSWVILSGHEYGSLVPELMPDGVNDGHSAYYKCSECGKYFDENYTEKEWKEFVYDASGDLLNLSKFELNSGFGASSSYDLRYSAQNGYGFHYHADAAYNNWPSIRIKLPKSYDLTHSGLAVTAKFETTKPRIAFKLYDSNSVLVSYGWQTAIDFLGTTSYIESLDWTTKTVSNSNLVAALQSGKDLSDVRYIDVGVDFNANHGISQDVYIDELHFVDGVYATNSASVENLEMGTYSAGQWRGYNSTPSICYDTYGSNSNSSLKITFQDTTATLPGRVYASFDLAQTPEVTSSNAIDVKNSTLSFDIKLSQEFYDANNPQFTFKHEDSSWAGIEKWYSYPGYGTGNPETWLHVSIDLSAKYGSETRNANTYAITLGFFGMTSTTVQTAWVIIDNLSITSNA